MCRSSGLGGARGAPRFREGCGKMVLYLTLLLLGTTSQSALYVWSQVHAQLAKQQCLQWPALASHGYIELCSNTGEAATWRRRAKAKRLQTFDFVDDAVQGERHLTRQLHVVQHRVHRLRAGKYRSQSRRRETTHGDKLTWTHVPWTPRASVSWAQVWCYHTQRQRKHPFKTLETP